jgi:hypothetical protein
MIGDVMDSSTGPSLMRAEPNVELRLNHTRNSVVYLDFPPPPVTASSTAAGGRDKQHLRGKGAHSHEFILESSYRTPADAKANHTDRKADGIGAQHSLRPAETNENQFRAVEIEHAGLTLDQLNTSLHLDATVVDNTTDLSADRSAVRSIEDRWPPLPPMPESSQAFPNPAFSERLRLEWNRRRKRDCEQEGRPWSV